MEKYVEFVEVDPVVREVDGVEYVFKYRVRAVRDFSIFTVDPNEDQHIKLGDMGGYVNDRESCCVVGESWVGKDVYLVDSIVDHSLLVGKVFGLRGKFIRNTSIINKLGLNEFIIKRSVLDFTQYPCRSIYNEGIEEGSQFIIKDSEVSITDLYGDIEVEDSNIHFSYLSNLKVRNISLNKINYLNNLVADFVNSRDGYVNTYKIKYKVNNGISYNYFNLVIVQDNVVESLSRVYITKELNIENNSNSNKDYFYIDDMVCYLDCLDISQECKEKIRSCVENHILINN